MRFARSGSSSEISIPFTLVLIGFHGPRTSSGAPGLGSQRSIWLGGPAMKKMINDLSPGPGLGGVKMPPHHPERKAPPALKIMITDFARAPVLAGFKSPQHHRERSPVHAAQADPASRVRRERG